MSSLKIVFVYCVRIITIVFLAGILSSGILGFFSPHHVLTTENGAFLPKEEVLSGMKLFAYGYSLILLLFGVWGTRGMPLKKDKKIVIILTTIFVFIVLLKWLIMGEF